MEIFIMDKSTGGAVHQWLKKATPIWFSAYAILASFSCYFCVYAYRKPFAVGIYSGKVDIPGLPSIDYKILLIMAQVVGYALSKFLGIKFVSELAGKHRAFAIVAVLLLSEIALFGFAVTPRHFSFVFLFLNGLTLGVVWGLVFGFLEGRSVSDALGAGLSASYIVASGFVKTVGRWCLDWGVPEVWMPFIVGLIFLAPLLLSVWLLNQLPPPTRQDELLRTKREPMTAERRRLFFTTYAPGLIALIGLYILLTAYRDFRDNFAREIWDALGFADTPSVLTSAEIPIALGVLVVLASVIWVRNNRRALLVIHGIMIGGTALIGLSTFLFSRGLLPPAAWMILVGLGLYIAYVPFGCLLFDRLMAAVGFVGTSGFIIYVADASGYLGSVAVLLYRNFGPQLSWLSFFTQLSYLTSIFCTLCFAASMLYFARETQAEVAISQPSRISA
jgi:hypothetical protein